MTTPEGYDLYEYIDDDNLKRQRPSSYVSIIEPSYETQTEPLPLGRASQSPQPLPTPPSATNDGKLNMGDKTSLHEINNSGSHYTNLQPESRENSGMARQELPKGNQSTDKTSTGICKKPPLWGLVLIGAIVVLIAIAIFITAFFVMRNSTFGKYVFHFHIFISDISV